MEMEAAFDGLLPSLLSPSFLERMKEVGGREGGGGLARLSFDKGKKIIASPEQFLPFPVRPGLQMQS